MSLNVFIFFRCGLTDSICLREIQTLQCPFVSVVVIHCNHVCGLNGILVIPTGFVFRISANCIVLNQHLTTGQILHCVEQMKILAVGGVELNPHHHIVHRDLTSVHNWQAGKHEMGTIGGGVVCEILAEHRKECTRSNWSLENVNPYNIAVFQLEVCIQMHSIASMQGVVGACKSGLCKLENRLTFRSNIHKTAEFYPAYLFKWNNSHVPDRDTFLSILSSRSLFFHHSCCSFEAL